MQKTDFLKVRFFVKNVNKNWKINFLMFSFTFNIKNNFKFMCYKKEKTNFSYIKPKFLHFKVNCHKFPIFVDSYRILTCALFLSMEDYPVNYLFPNKIINFFKHCLSFTEYNYTSVTDLNLLTYVPRTHQ